jgi:RNA polymerase sigma-70 factor, ECF subfamily
METIELPKGLTEEQQHETQTANQQQFAEAIQAAENHVLAADSNEANETQRPPDRRGYRQDSPPEVLALLHEAQAGDREAFAEIYKLHADHVTRYVATRMRDRNRDAIPDLVQDAFCDAFADLPTAHNDVRGWLLAHAAKACIRHDWSNRRYIRAAKTVQEHEARAVNPPVQPPEESTPAIGRAVLVHALARLVPDQRRALQLRFLDGLPKDMRVDALDRTPNAVKLLEHRALRKLRAEFMPALGGVALE